METNKHKTQIEIIRVDQWINKARAIKLFANGEKIGSIKNGEVKFFELPEGQHSIHAKIDWCTTPPVDIDLKAGTTLSFELGSDLSAWNTLKVLHRAFIARDRYIYLKRIDD